ncbi:MAG: DNA polymerase III subunit beta [Capsulimonadales bacterium]|nr:DNA polymerase III subunit beta [Capsulimonadales bacterium]
MQAVCPRKDLYEAVQTVGRAVSGRSTLPILSHILARPQGDGSLRLTATDLEMWMECNLPARLQGTLDGGEETLGFTVPARVFTEMLAALPDDDVRLDRPDGGNKIQVQCRRSEYNILGLPAEEFPAPPEVTTTASFTLSGELLRDMIRHVLFAVSTDETRPILTGVLLSYNGDILKMVATDTHRLAVRTAKIPGGDGNATAIVPARAMNELLRLAGDEDTITISLAAGQCRIEVGKTTMVTRLLEGQFPNYERVIPQGHDRKLTLERDEFARAVKRAAIVARDNANRVKLETEGAQLILSAESGTVGSVREEIEVAREGDDIQIAFNAKYLQDVLNVVETDGVVLELTEPLRPGLLRPIGENDADYLCVLMPMQVI